VLLVSITIKVMSVSTRMKEKWSSGKKRSFSKSIAINCSIICSLIPIYQLLSKKVVPSNRTVRNNKLI